MCDGAEGATRDSLGANHPAVGARRRIVLTERGEHAIQIGVVAGVAVPPLQAHALARPQHEGPALLGRIALDATRPEAAAEGAQVAEEAPRMEDAQEPRGEAGRFVGPQRGIGEEGALVAGDLAEARQMLGLAGADDDQLAAALVDLRQDFDEASNLLVAEQSAEVADEGEHDGPGLPVAAERDRRAALVEHGERRQRRGQGIAHARHCN
jgi:hypothetical protein